MKSSSFEILEGISDCVHQGIRDHDFTLVQEKLKEIRSHIKGQKGPDRRLFEVAEMFLVSALAGNTNRLETVLRLVFDGYMLRKTLEELALGVRLHKSYFGEHLDLLVREGVIQEDKGINNSTYFLTPSLIDFATDLCYPPEFRTWSRVKSAVHYMNVKGLRYTQAVEYLCSSFSISKLDAEFFAKKNGFYYSKSSRPDGCDDFSEEVVDKETQERRKVISSAKKKTSGELLKVAQDAGVYKGKKLTKRYR